MLRSTNPRRRTSHVPRRPASAFIHAPRIAAKIGRPLNTQVVIRWAWLGCPDDEASKVFERLRLGPFAKWSRYIPARQKRSKNGAPTYSWVFEATNGLHVHWCVHIEPGREDDFARSVRRWVKTATMAADTPGDNLVGIKPIEDINKLKLYLLKGADPFYAERFCRIKKIESQGEVIGKRCGVSLNLSRSARVRIEGRWKRGGHSDDPLRR